MAEHWKSPRSEAERWRREYEEDDERVRGVAENEDDLLDEDVDDEDVDDQEDDERTNA